MLLEHSSGQQVPDRFHSTRTVAEDAVVEYEGKIAIARDDGHAVADFQVRARGDLHGGMLGGEALNWALRVVAEGRGGAVVADRLPADVEDGPVLGGARDDGREQGQCRHVAGDMADPGVVVAGE